MIRRTCERLRNRGYGVNQTAEVLTPDHVLGRNCERVVVVKIELLNKWKLMSFATQGQCWNNVEVSQVIIDRIARAAKIIIMLWLFNDVCN